MNIEHRSQKAVLYFMIQYSDFMKYEALPRRGVTLITRGRSPWQKPGKIAASLEEPGGKDIANVRLAGISRKK